ncbi:alpha-glucosidase AglA [Fervidobacterium thailandense]|uniref:Alpha-glucosidase/alpha-galactosidase n=1 Tax=Fervidobacterium thailandense TaxID=1008305 RepID=A0A1E3G1J8_9BACT|nr:alpha-glucosidase AglA [Fervidobacterium thailandense]ODN30144.1 alpha-glucosidase/alpha-galactosidase [Fervidobacterium thailandense]
MANLRISIIGAGSAVFSMRIVSDLCKMPKLSGTEVVLMDIDEERLENFLVLARELTEFFGANLKFEKTLSLRKAIEGADFVINTALAGGHEYLNKVRAIGEKYGYYRGIDAQNYNFVTDYLNLTNWNQMTLFLKIANLIKELAPNAWYLQAANPVLEGTTLVSTETGIKMVGFCHGHFSVETLAELVGVKDYEWQVAGVNHGIWLTKFESRDGKNLYEELVKYADKPHKPSTPFDDQLSPVAWDMYRTYGLFPIGDTVRNSTWKYHRNLETKKRWYGEPWGGADSELGWEWYVSQLNAVVNMIELFAKAVKNGQKLTNAKDVVLNAIPHASEEWKNLIADLLDPSKLSREQHVPFIDSVVNSERRRFVVNVLNNGKIKGLDDDIAVEVCAYVEGEKFEFEEVSLPKRVLEWYLKPRTLLAKQALEVFKTKNLKLLEDILERDPRTKSSEQVRKVIDELYPIMLKEQKKVEEQE